MPGNTVSRSGSFRRQRRKRTAPKLELHFSQDNIRSNAKTKKHAAPTRIRFFVRQIRRSPEAAGSGSLEPAAGQLWHGSDASSKRPKHRRSRPRMNTGVTQLRLPGTWFGLGEVPHPAGPLAGPQSVPQSRQAQCGGNWQQGARKRQFAPVLRSPLRVKCMGCSQS